MLRSGLIRGRALRPWTTTHYPNRFPFGRRGRHRVRRDR